MSNDERDDEEESFQDNTSEINNSTKDTTIGDKLKEFMEELEENLRYCAKCKIKNSNSLFS